VRGTAYNRHTLMPLKNPTCCLFSSGAGVNGVPGTNVWHALDSSACTPVSGGILLLTITRVKLVCVCLPLSDFSGMLMGVMA
jgi:hypothetical protein